LQEGKLAFGREIEIEIGRGRRYKEGSITCFADHRCKASLLSKKLTPSTVYCCFFFFLVMIVFLAVPSQAAENARR
jgi:hypothetical protein